MKGDFSRLSFDPAKHYSGVRMQQGRVQLDADWNEQADIIAHRIATEIKDFIGESGAPEKDAGFKISVGGALKLNGENAYMTVENLNIPAEIWTIEFWFRWDGDGDRKNCLFSLGNTVAVSITNGQLKPEVQNMPVIASGRWYHIAFVYDQQSCLVYLDGNSYGEIEIDTASSGEFCLGANSSGTDYFNGAFDELRIWKKARWQSEINKWKDSPLPMNDEGWDTDVLGYWTFDSKNELGKNYKANSPDGNPINCEPLELFTIGKGRYYVDGMLIENEANVLYEQQPDYPGETLPEGNGDNLFYFYLDVWQRHISALEDPAIREVALGGPDTAARIKNVWQVKCIADGADKPFQISSGTLRAEQPAAGTTLENRLYRVEIHESGSWDKATFKWSRDNGSVGARVESISGNRLVLSGLVAPATALFKPGEWLELTDDARELKNEPGVFVWITELHADGVSVEGDILTDYTDPQQLGAHNPRVIRWDGGVPCLIKDAQPADGIALTFSAGDYRSGDYWLIPMRAASGGIAWPAGSAQPPHGVYHHYVDLAVAKKENDRWEEPVDKRDTFKPLTYNVLSQGGIINGQLDVRGSVIIGTKNEPKDLYVCGELYGPQTTPLPPESEIPNLCDRRLKQNIQTLSGALVSICQLRGIHFEWRTTEFPKLALPAGRHMGVVAQEVQTVAADLVAPNQEGYLTVEYNGLVALLIEAIKELNNDNRHLRTRIEQLERHVYAEPVVSATD